MSSAKPPSTSMLAIHAAALDARSSAYHEFLGRFSKRKKVVYGFVEGKADPTFYRGFIDHALPDGWEVELWPAGNKTSVLKVYASIDWRRFPKKRVCFFVDRDLSQLLSEKLPSDSNIYITDCYSIENDIVRRGTVRRALTEVFGFAAANHGEIDKVCDTFERELERFLKSLSPLMAWVLFWRRKRLPANLNNIYMQHLFECKGGILHSIAEPKGNADLCEYIHCQCDILFDSTADISDCIAEFRKALVYRRFVRGKYLMWFLVEFCVSVYEDYSTFFPSLSRQPHMSVTVSQSNGIQILGPRARIPKSLRDFLTSTFCEYTECHSI